MYIIDKNLKIRINTSVIYKVFNNLIKMFKPALCNIFNEKIFDINYEWYISRKFDGVRCLTFFDYKNINNIKFYSREGKEFNTLNFSSENLRFFKISNI